MHEPDLWNWFASAQAKAEFTEHLRLHLLKSTYRLDPESHPELYQLTEAAKSSLHLDIPVTLYQAQGDTSLNAVLYFIPGEGHIVFSGSILTLLSPQELQAIIGHELAHYLLWQYEDGTFHIADRLLTSTSKDSSASECHVQTARLFQLYTEIFADRGALCVTNDLDPVVASLVKVETNLNQVSAASYLKQAEEIFSKENVTTKAFSHPETFIRARALALWHEQGEESANAISQMIEGTICMDDLDLLGQNQLSQKTRLLLEYLIQPSWFQTPGVLGHAKMFFPDFEPAKTRDVAVLKDLKFTDPKLREYLCYILLDFVTADPDLEDMPLAAALELAQHLECDAELEKILVKELQMKVRNIRKIKGLASVMLTKAEEAK